MAGGPVRQPYAGVDFIPQSTLSPSQESLNSATDVNLQIRIAIVVRAICDGCVYLAGKGRGTG